MTNNQKIELYFLLSLIGVVFVLTFFIFKPFIFALILAVVFAIVFAPLHKRSLAITNNRNGLSAVLTTSIILTIIVVPTIFLGVQILQEASGLYSYIVDNRDSIELTRFISSTIKSLEVIFPVPGGLSFDINQYIKEGLDLLLQSLGSIFANVAKIFVGVFVFLVALYYLFKDGRRFKREIIALSPLEDVHDEVIYNKLVSSTNSVIGGNIVVALVQGTLTAVGLAIFGVPNTALWGSLASLSALIPGVGTALVILPAVAYLFLKGEATYAMGLFLWGVVIVGLADNLLRPKLALRGMQIHPLLILLSILGGISFFGPLGFLLGPLVLSLFFALIEIYFAVKKKHE